MPYKRNLDIHFDRLCTVVRHLKRTITYEYNITEHELDQITRIAEEESE